MANRAPRSAWIVATFGRWVSILGCHFLSRASVVGHKGSFSCRYAPGCGNGTPWILDDLKAVEGVQGPSRVRW